MENNMINERKAINMAIFMHEISHYLFTARKAHLLYSNELADLVKKYTSKIENGTEEDIVNVAKFICDKVINRSFSETLDDKIKIALGIIGES